jgi:FdhE protein
LVILKLNQKPWTIEGVRREIKTYLETNPELAEIMGLYEHLLSIEAEYIPLIDTKVEADEASEIEKVIGEGKSLLDTTKIYVDPVMFKEILTKMANVISDLRPEFKEGLDRLVAYPDVNVDTEGATPVFIDALLNFNTQYFTKIGELIDLNNDIMFFVIYHAISPFIEKASYEFRDKFDYDAWQKTTCPVCGRKSSMSIIRREDDLHILQCQACRTHWTYPAETCVICGNNDPETYEYLFDKSDEAHRAYVCNVCKKYIKTTDERIMGRDVDVEIEDLATLVLDFVAKQNGYEPGGRITFAVSLEVPEDDEAMEMPEEISLD